MTDDRIDPREIDRALARGAEKNRRLSRALDTIARELERDPGAAARVLRSWMTEPPRPARRG